MDPAAVATAAVGLLVTYLRRLGGKLSDEASAELDDAALKGLQRLLQAVRRRASGDRYVGGALARLEEAPDDERRKEALRLALLEIVESDPSFRGELQRLIEETHTGDGVRIEVSDSGAVSVGGEVVIEGQYAAGRDMTIGRPRPTSGD